ncbi:MAG: nitrile hydratase accessory protein [Salaquimonas sp.]
MDKSTSQEALKAVPSIPRECGDAVFAEPWEARAFAMAVALNEQGLFTWPQWAERFGAALEANTRAGEPRTYYQVWMATLEEVVEVKGIANAEARGKRDHEWLAAAARTPHGQPIEL